MLRREREEAVTALAVAGSFAKAERGGVLGFHPKDPVASPDALLHATQVSGPGSGAQVTSQRRGAGASWCLSAALCTTLPSD